MVSVRKSAQLFGVAMACGLALGCADAVDNLVGSPTYGTLTANEEAAAAAQLVFLPTDADATEVRAAAGEAAGRISPSAAITRIFSAEQSAIENPAAPDAPSVYYRIQMEMTDRSIWEAIVLSKQPDRYEVVRLERVG